MKFKNRKEKAHYILEEIEKLFPEGKTELINWETPFQFLVSIVLSAQTTDAQVNSVTATLFRSYPTPHKLAHADQEVVSNLIGKINYRNSKAKHIVALSKKIVEEFGGEVPLSVEKLITLPGVGPKSANVFLNELLELNEGIGVDTHIMRISRRFGLTTEKDPEKIARDLQRLYRKADWHKVNNLFVLYGRYYCKARVTPENSRCIFKGICSNCTP